MGIKDLWAILNPFCERKPLFELQGKTVAVDLSCWVCESQNITDYSIQPRMYLRNLYFRTCYLLLMDVNVIFVLEGRAPELKYKTIAARNAQQFKGQKPKTDGIKTGKDRTRFNFTLKQCEEMLKLMGLICIKGEGEAEALCASLNADGLVDGIISQDSDCFAYGAKTVYRNFSISQQGNQASKGGSVDVYDITKAITNLNFGRNKIIALALLCGSDYNPGVYGIGKDSVLKLFNTIHDDDILPRLRLWKNQNYYQQLEEQISDKNLCNSCGHSGKLQNHTKKGCVTCGTTHGCDSIYKTKRLEIKNELTMISKASKDPEFPNENLIDEFLKPKSNISGLNLTWRQPDLINFIKFTVKFLGWEEIYSFEKFLPILTRWQIVYFNEIKSKSSGMVYPKFIKKHRNPKGVASYEIIWEDRDDQFIDIIPTEQLQAYGDLEKLWSTIEPQNLVDKAYPDLVTQFEAKKPKKLKKKTVHEINNLLQNIGLSKPTLDNFIQKGQSTPKQNPNVSFDLNQSKFGDENDLEVSDIIDDIINRKLPSYIPDNLNQLGLRLDENCSFFMNEMTENDLFEKTFREYCNTDSD